MKGSSSSFVDELGIGMTLISVAKNVDVNFLANSRSSLYVIACSHFFFLAYGSRPRVQQDVRVSGLPLPASI
jgi:hypothetical protein